MSAKPKTSVSFLPDESILELMTDFNLTRDQVLHFKAEFQAYDIDDDGDICTEDLGHVNRAFGGNASDDALQSWVGHECDHDGDGTMNFKEFINCKVNCCKHEHEHENLARKAFQELDKDRSGFITAEELKSGLMEKLEQKVDQMIKEADVDGDHKISFLEFAKINNVESALPAVIKTADGEPPKPPDGGWGWVVVFACFMCNFIVEGFGYSFGIILKPLMHQFDASKGGVSFVGSLLSGVNAMLGPIIGALLNKYGMRPVCIAGAIIGTIGLAVAPLSTSLPLLMLTVGVITGIGAGAITLPANIAVGHYFEKNRALATGISQTGSGVGQFVFAPLLTFLLASGATVMNSDHGHTSDGTNGIHANSSSGWSGPKLYTVIDNTTGNVSGTELPTIHSDDSTDGWKNVFWVAAGLYFTCAIFGFLLRPLEIKEESTVEGDKIKKQLVFKPSSLKFWGQKSDESDHKYVSPFSRSDLFFRGTNKTLKESIRKQQGPSAWDDFRHLIFLESSIQENKKDEKKGGILDTVKEFINLKLLVTPMFLLMALNGFLGMLGFFVPLFFLPGMAEKNGVEPWMASYLISIYAVCNIVGKLFTGWLSDKNCISAFSLFNGYIFSCGVLLFFFPLCNSFGLYAFLAALYGFFTTFFVLKTIVLVELLGIENLTSAFSLLQLFEGIASIIGPTVAGELYEATGQSYDIPFYVAGTFFLLAGLISVGAQILHWKTRKQQ